ncbi:TPA: hypothetical protein HA238_01660 [Candidatus Micrarchaeota archaeon]|nr:hypothetical protein [Candidatus Micrarchaeota archaeon]
MDSNTIIKDAAEGAAKGALEFSAEKIDLLVKRFAQGDLAFIEDEANIQLVKDQRKTPEWNQYIKYIKDKDLRLQLEMGLSLKRLQNDKLKRKRLLDLKQKILIKYGDRGVHIAQLVQNGLFGRYVGLLVGNTNNDKEMEEGINSVLLNIDRYVLFVKETDQVEYTSKTIVTRINALVPKAIIIFSRGPIAVKIAKKIIEKTKKEIMGYRFENQIDLSSYQQYDFILKVPDQI